MQNGITYIVRPRMHPVNSLSNLAFISSGATQLFVGPASSFRSEQMNVLASQRATSAGSDRARKLPGLRVSESLVKTPVLQRWSVSIASSSSLPSQR